MVQMSQGRNAVRHGTANEEDAEGALVRHGYRLFHLSGLQFGAAIAALKNEMHQPNLPMMRPLEGVFAKQVPLCVGIYKTVVYEDYLLYRPEWPDVLALSMKHQKEDGSCDKKIEHLYAEITECYPCRCMVVLEGDGFKRGVRGRGLEYVRWKSRGKLATIFNTIGDFRRWVTDGSLYPPIITASIRQGDFL
jgi:hypothetical protein